MLFWKSKPRNVRLIVGLGNPGEDYARNRHNIGFMCIHDLARKHGIHLNRRRRTAHIGQGTIAGNNVVLIRPQSFMNRSGQAVSYLLRYYRIPRDRLIVIHDDLDLPSGTVRIRQGGSSGGHKGVLSITEAVGSGDFIRIKVGIGRPVPNGDHDVDITGYVLGNLTADEERTFANVIPRVSEVIESILKDGLAAAMNRFN